ncbi:MAG: hypothetical protein ACLR8Y_15540 [Alistipes indistinctus]
MQKTSGGVLTIGLIEKENFKGATLDADSDAYSAITLAAQSAFSKYEFLEDEGGVQGGHQAREQARWSLPSHSYSSCRR